MSVFLRRLQNDALKLASDAQEFIYLRAQKNSNLELAVSKRLEVISENNAITVAIVTINHLANNLLPNLKHENVDARKNTTEIIISLEKEMTAFKHIQSPVTNNIEQILRRIIQYSKLI